MFGTAMFGAEQLTAAGRAMLQVDEFAKPHPMTEPDVMVREIDRELWEAHLSELGLMPRVLWERRWLADFEPMRSKYLHAGPRPDFVSPVRWRD